MSKLYIKNRYGVVPNDVLNNTSISFKAKGLFAFLQSKPDGWKFSVERIALQSKDGKSAITEGLKELEKAGFLRRIPNKNEKGRWSGYDYILSENPFTENPSTDNVATISNKDISNKDKELLLLSPNGDMHNQVKDLFDFYLICYNQKISKIRPVFNWGQCEKLAKPHIRQLGLERMKLLLKAYLDSNDKLFRENAWSLSCFLSAKIIHRLNANLKN